MVDKKAAAILKQQCSLLIPHFLVSHQMTDPRLIDEIGAKMAEVLANSPARDVQMNLRALMASFFDRFDLVTREDFEVQKRVLERAHARILELETRVVELETHEAREAPRA